MDAIQIRNVYSMGLDEDEPDNRKIFNLMVEAIAQLAEASSALRDLADSYQKK